jgi:beta-N-acetylhexosaminidase
MTKRRIWAVAVCVAAIAALGASVAVAIASAGPEAGGTPAPEGTVEPTQPTSTLPTSSTAATPPVSTPTPPPAAAKLTVGQAIGQMLMSHVTGLSASATLLKRIRAGQVGSVILYSENISSTAQLTALTGSLQRAAHEGHNPPLLIGTDQEGGPVKRLGNAPPWLSAAEMGATRHVRSVAQAEGRAAGRALLKAGINLDFAPVADVPTNSNNFLGERAFGENPRAVEEGVTGFASGLEEAHVGSSLKHFPGLGGAGPRDTDTEIVTIDLSKSQLSSAWAPYRAVARLSTSVAPFVMISNAIYPALSSSGLPADLTPNIVRNELTSTGLGNRVTITDDLQVPAVERYLDVAVKAVRAGIDLLMFAQEEAASEHAFRELEAAVRAGTLTTANVMTAADRVVALKNTLLK